ncbi:MAG: ComEC/Rec2 family competence protein [Terriglobia bacterium]
MKSPVLLLALAFALGILVAESTGGNFAALLAAGAACLVLAFLSVRRNRLFVAGVLVLAGFAFAGAAALRLFQNRFPADHISRLGSWGLRLDRPLLVQGIIATNPLAMPYGVQFDLSVSQISDGVKTRAASGKIRLRVLSGENSPLPAEALDLHYGETIRARARLKPPQDDQNPGGFDYRRWIESIQDIYWQGVVDGAAGVQKIPGPKSPLLRRTIEGVRERLTAGIDRLYPPWSLEGRDGAVLKAILLGDRSSLDTGTIEGFRKSGLYHLLVVAGLHVGLLVLLAEGLLRLLRLRETRRVALLLAFLCVYAALVEQRAPTLRASLMIGAYLLARLLDRDQPALNAIGIAALVLLFRRPAWLFDSGFQLSFAAALLIAGLAGPALERLTEPYRRALRALDDPARDIAFAPRAAQFRLDARDTAALLGGIFPALGERRALKGVSAALRVSIWLADLIVFSAVLQLGLLLPMTEIFHRVTLAGIGLNALAVPLMTILLAIAAPVAVLGAFSTALAAFPAKLLAVIMKALFALTELPRLPHWLSFRVPAPPLWVAAAFAIALILAAYGFRFHRATLRASGFGAAVFGILIALHPFRPRVPAGVFEATQLDCGGGEGLFVVLPGRTTVLIGAGGGRRRWFAGGDPLRSRRWDPGENVVSPYLWSRGIKSIDVFLVPDVAGDHLNGVASILRNFRVKQFWHGDLPPGADSAAIARLVESYGVAVRHLERGAAIRLGESEVEVLWNAPATSAARRRTGTPMLVRITNADGSILLAADLNRTDQAQLLRSTARLSSTVLAAADVRPELISRVDPAVVLDASQRLSRTAALTVRDHARPDPLRPRLFRVADAGATTVSMAGGVIAVRSYSSDPR